MSRIGSECLGWVFITGCVLWFNYIFHVMSPELVNHRWLFGAGVIAANLLCSVAAGWWGSYIGTFARGMGWFGHVIERGIGQWLRWRGYPYVTVPADRFDTICGRPAGYPGEWDLWWLHLDGDVRRWCVGVIGYEPGLHPLASKYARSPVCLFFRNTNDAFHFKMRWL